MNQAHGQFQNYNETDPEVNLNLSDLLYPRQIHSNAGYAQSLIISGLENSNTLKSGAMNMTPFQSKYFAYELTKRCASDYLPKLAISFSDAQVDLNPHQVQAALFAFRSPVSKGAKHWQRKGESDLLQDELIRTHVAIRSARRG